MIRVFGSPDEERVFSWMLRGFFGLVALMSPVILYKGCVARQRQLETDHRTLDAYYRAQIEVERHLGLKAGIANFPYKLGTEGNYVTGIVESSSADYLRFRSWVSFADESGQQIKKEWSATLRPRSYPHGPWNPVWEIIEFKIDD